MFSVHHQIVFQVKEVTILVQFNANFGHDEWNSYISVEESHLKILLDDNGGILLQNCKNCRGK